MHDERPLTTGEIKLARSIFGEAIDYAPVRLRRRKWAFFHPRGTMMAPCGHIHVHPQSALWSADYSKERISLQALLLHELTHVWQAQERGSFYLPLMRHPFCRYDYALRPGRPFDRYGLEQQAEIVRHVFLLRSKVPVAGAPPLATLEGVLPFRAT
ncbi:MAG: vgr related protein [Sphingosinicella sp.]